MQHRGLLLFTGAQYVVLTQFICFVHVCSSFFPFWPLWYISINTTPIFSLSSQYEKCTTFCMPFICADGLWMHPPHVSNSSYAFAPCCESCSSETIFDFPEEAWKSGRLTQNLGSPKWRLNSKELCQVVLCII